VLLEFGRDIALPSGICAGMSHNANWQLRLGFTNNSAISRKGYKVNVIFYDKYYMELEVGGSSNRNGIINREVVEMGLSQMTDPENKLEYKDNVMIGHGFFSDVRDKIYKWLPTIRKGLQTASQATSGLDNPMAKTFSNVSGVVGNSLQDLGFGKKRQLSKKYS